MPIGFDKFKKKAFAESGGSRRVLPFDSKYINDFLEEN